MTKAAAFTQADITRAQKGMKAAGQKLCRITITTPSGAVMVIEPVDQAAPMQSAVNSWNDVG